MFEFESRENVNIDFVGEANRFENNSSEFIEFIGRLQSRHYALSYIPNLYLL